MLLFRGDNLGRSRHSRLLALVAIGLLGGCTYERVVSDGWSGMRQFAEETAPAPVSGPSSTSPLEGWGIRMASLRGEDASKRARGVIAYLERKANVPDLWSRPRDGGVDVFRGRYVSATDMSAQNDLRQTRMLVIDGERPYAQVELVPLAAEGDDRPMHPADLRTHTGMYSLQIAYFDDSMGAGYREAAEDAVRALREEGVEAFYYHGPFRSLVTAGLFSYPQAFVPGAHGQDTYAPPVLELQERFPCNLANTCTLEAQQRAERQGAPASFLVKAP